MTRGEAMTQPTGSGLRAVRLWLYAVAALVVLMVVVGGATRLTESGLSITEWKPVTGVLPPLSEAQWQAEFNNYKAIPQYELLNKGMDIHGFKRIFWWEWAHRLLGRVIGFAFALPFIYFVIRGTLRGTLLVRSLGLFVLGGLQGAVGWWMVASGLSGRVSVSQYRLAIHLTLACLILSATVAVARGLTPRPSGTSSRGLAMGAGAILVLIFVQIFAGGLVAGLDAGMTFNSWPLIDGRLIPDPEKLGLLNPVWRNVFENVLTVQFQHRMIAYTLWLATLAHAIHAHRVGGFAAQQAWLLFAMVTGQAALGVMTLLYFVKLDVALTHQFGATVVLIMATVHLSDLCRKENAAIVAAPSLSSAPA